MPSKITSIIGRYKEQHALDAILNAPVAQLIAIYGRRRIGKTFLVREFFRNKGQTMEVVGSHRGSMAHQLKIFSRGFSECFFRGIPLQTPSSWDEAFMQLTEQLHQILPSKKKIILFFDEIPWLATPRSRFIETLDHFWNTKWSLMPNLRIVLCGSAASWMMEHLINAKGGLHNRLTHAMLLQPFNLSETKAFLASKKSRLTDRQILDLYLVTGGVPYYLERIDPTQSIVENIQRLCFSQDGLLYNEFENLFLALFDEADINIKIIRAISTARKGLSREMLIKKTKLSSGGTLNKRLTELKAAGFIQEYVPYGKVRREIYYRIIDEYSFFYLRWVEPEKKTGYGFMTNHWHTKALSPDWKSWAGYSFESICLKHIPQIARALALDKLSCSLGSWRYTPPPKSHDAGAEIDLLFDRSDNAITVCEIKYSSDEYVIDKATAMNLAHKLTCFEEQTKTKKQLFLIMITVYGVKRNIWSEDLIMGQVVLSDLFRLV